MAEALSKDKAVIVIGYPVGPLAWGRRIGFERVTQALHHLAHAYGEDRYRTSLWLQCEVKAAQPLISTR